MTRRRALWGVAGVLIVGLIVATFLMRPPASVPLRFWVRMDGADDAVYATRDGAEIRGWAWRHFPLKSSGIDIVRARWRSGSARDLAQQAGVLPRSDGDVLGVLLPSDAPDDVWRECLSTNREWPDDVAADEAFAGEWEEVGGQLADPARRVFDANGSTTRVEHPSMKWRWGRAGDVIVLGMWHAVEKRWTMADSLIVAPDGQTYRTSHGATGRRVR